MTDPNGGDVAVFISPAKGGACLETQDEQQLTVPQTVSTTTTAAPTVPDFISGQRISHAIENDIDSVLPSNFF